MAEAKPRLFVCGDDATDGTSFYCGGPDPADASKGLMHLLESHVECLLDDTRDVSEITLSVRMMTDEEVDALPDY